MALLEDTREDQVRVIAGRVFTGPELSHEGRFQVHVGRTEGDGRRWSLCVEVGEGVEAMTEQEAEYPYENLSWQGVAALAITRVM